MINFLNFKNFRCQNNYHQEIIGREELTLGLVSIFQIFYFSLNPNFFFSFEASSKKSNGWFIL
jgi:hypothetical protein